MKKYFRNGETICGDKNLKIFSLDTHANRRIGENNQRSVKMTNPFLSSQFRLSSQLSVCLLNLFKEKLGYIHKGRPKKVVSVAVSGQCICLKLHKHTYQLVRQWGSKEDCRLKSISYRNFPDQGYHIFLQLDIFSLQNF